MKKIFVLCAVAFAGSANSQIQKDKQLHFAAGVVSGAFGYEYVYSITKDKKKAFVGGILTSVLTGVAKEAYDSTNPKNKFDFKDLTATTLGGISVNMTIKLFNKNKNKNEKNINITLLSN